MCDFVLLNDGNKIPIIGLGVYQAAPKDTYACCMSALKMGYRHIDTAALYGNEAEVGKAVRDCGLPRSEIYVTTKLWNNDQGYEKALKACETSLQKLGLDYIDLYLIHSPVESLRLESWKALEKLQKDGKVKSIGVSNYNIHHLKEILDDPERTRPVINQLELHPYLYHTRKELLDFCKNYNIVIEAYSPLTRGKKLTDKKLITIANKYNKSPAQILLRWCIEKRFVILPKSVHEDRIKENFDLFDWKLDAKDMDLLDSFDEGLTVAWNPLEWD